MNTAEPKTGNLTAVVQIAGNPCKVCGQIITLSSEGKACPHCQTVVHAACDHNETCMVCSQAYRAYERPPVDPLSEAVLPRALRPARSGAPALALFIMALLIVAMLIIWFGLTHLTGD
jgi:hypothetical protein